VFAHATHFVILPALAGLLLLERGLDSRRLAPLLGAGVLLGTSVLMKQHAALFVALGLALVLSRDLGRRPRAERASMGAASRRAGTLALGVLVPFIVMGATLAAQGVLGRFWLWTIQYARAYVTEVPWSGALPALASGLGTVTAATWALWWVAAFGLVGLWLAPWRRETRTFACAFMAASFLAACPGFYFRAHYFIVMLPALAVLVGVGIVSLQRLCARHLTPRAAPWSRPACSSPRSSPTSSPSATTCSR
jgi:hypothetical protein